MNNNMQINKHLTVFCKCLVFLRIYFLLRHFLIVYPVLVASQAAVNSEYPCCGTDNTNLKSQILKE